MTSGLRFTRLAFAWGAFWGTALGFWLLVPRLLNVHHLAPQSAAQWAVVYTSLLVFFSGTGALLNVFACAPLFIWQGIRRRKFRRPAWVVGLGSPPLLAIVYLSWCVFAEWVALRGLSIFDHYRPYLLPAAGVVAVWIAASLVIYRTLVIAREPPYRALRIVLGAGLAAGLAMVPARVDGPPSTPLVGEPELRPIDRSAPRPPVLFVGIDGATWRTIEPLSERGAIPTLADLVKHGVHGEVEALWKPYWSAPAWSAILTGYPREATGIYEDLAMLAPGLPPLQAPLILDLPLNALYFTELLLVSKGVLRLTHPRRDMLARAPVWERLTDAGIATAVVRFRFTFPANESNADVVVTDWTGHDQWSITGLDTRAPPEQLAAPAPEAEALLEPFSHERESSVPSLTAFIADPDYPKPVDAKYHPIEMLSFAADIDARTLAATHDILARHPDLGFLAVYLGGLDTVQHAFWQYRFPEDFPDSPPAPQDVAMLGSTIDRYLEWLDRELQRLIAAYPTPPIVVLVSDHGYEAIHRHALWRGWHARRDGIFIVSGPGIEARKVRIDVSYFDIVPTIFELTGFEPLSTLPGRSVLSRPGTRVADTAALVAPRPGTQTRPLQHSPAVESTNPFAPSGGER